MAPRNRKAGKLRENRVLLVLGIVVAAFAVYYIATAVIFTGSGSTISRTTPNDNRNVCYLAQFVSPTRVLPKLPGFSVGEMTTVKSLYDDAGKPIKAVPANVTNAIQHIGASFDDVHSGKESPTNASARLSADIGTFDSYAASNCKPS